MSWGAVAGAAIGVVGSAMSDKGGGGGGGGGASQTSSSEPWMMAQPWMLQNIAQGQKLQTQYQDQPFSPQQLAAINNQYGANDYIRNLVPSLLGQLSGQQLGFDRGNVNAKPQAWDWTGGRVDGSPNMNQSSLLSALASADSKPKEDDGLGDFRQQDYSFWPSGGGGRRAGTDSRGVALLDGDYSWLMDSGDKAGKGTGGYGEFRYGMPKPQAGTQAYKDMMTYFNLGGYDPAGAYGVTANKPTAGMYWANSGGRASVSDGGQ